jgi:uncharacterized protein YndB with AHSA1/START domain
MPFAASARAHLDVSNDEPVVTITRMLSAPRPIVWRAVSEPEHVVAWWGPRAYASTVEAYDFRPDGEWRIRTDMPDGSVVFAGQFRAIAAPKEIVRTFGMAGMWDGRHSVETMTLAAEGDRTLFRVVARFMTMADRDGMLASGMEKGMNEGFDRLDELLAGLRAAA